MYCNQTEKEEFLVCYWSRIVYRFSRHFAQTYSTSKKAHFDSLPPNCKVVDGARLKWCNLLLLDAIVSILDTDLFSASTRRAFNQQKVLHDAILREIKQTNAKTENSPGVDGSQLPDIATKQEGVQFIFNRGEVIPEHVVLRIEALNGPWTDLYHLKQAMVDTPTTKSRAKYLQIVDLLMNHSALELYQFNLQDCLNAIVRKVIKGYNNSVLKQRATGADNSGSSSNNSSDSSKAPVRATKRSSRTTAASNRAYSSFEVTVTDQASGFAFAQSLLFPHTQKSRTSIYLSADEEEENCNGVALKKSLKTSEKAADSAVSQLMARASRSHADATQLLHDSRYFVPTRFITNVQNAEEDEAGDGESKKRRLSLRRQCTLKQPKYRHAAEEEEEEEGDEVEGGKGHLVRRSAEGCVAPPSTPVQTKKRRTSEQVPQQLHQQQQQVALFSPVSTPEKGMFTPSREQQHLFSSAADGLNYADVKQEDPLPHWSKYEQYSSDSLLLGSSTEAGVSVSAALTRECLLTSGSADEQDFWEHLHGLFPSQEEEAEVEVTQVSEALTDSCSSSSHRSGDSHSGDSPFLPPLAPGATLWSRKDSSLLLLPAPHQPLQPRAREYAGSTTSEGVSSCSSAVVQEMMFGVNLSHIRAMSEGCSSDGSCVNVSEGGFVQTHSNSISLHEFVHSGESTDERSVADCKSEEYSAHPRNS